MLTAILIIALVALVFSLPRIYRSLVWFVLDCLVDVYAAHAAVIERFGKRTGRVLFEGLHFKWPLIDKVQTYSLRLEVIGITDEFTTKDRVKLIASGSLQYQPDMTITRDAAGVVGSRATIRMSRFRFFAGLFGASLNAGQVVFVDMSDDIIKTGIAKAVEAALGALGGVAESDDFITKRASVARLIDCTLRLPVLPHVRDGILPKDALQYYEDKRNEVDRELKNRTERSPLEARYGIQITTFALADIAFDPETMRSLERDRQARAREEAFKRKIAMAKQVVDLGTNATTQEALNAADVSLDPAIRKTIVSVEGSGQALVIPGLEQLFGGGGKGETPSADAKGKKKGAR